MMYLKIYQARYRRKSFFMGFFHGVHAVSWRLASKGLDCAVGGWSINAIGVYESGFPLQDHAEHQQQFGVRLCQPAAQHRRLSGVERRPGIAQWATTS
ncbi:MAG TPA: hypothetical protein VKJ01_25255, partial [Candidatus Solibacter sp.]|nr:hypothetical protein [Candidatus Solibacter sp.]